MDKPLHDGNGHKVDEMGNLLYDEQCYGCDSPKPETTTNPSTDWEKQVRDYFVGEVWFGLDENGENDELDDAIEFIRILLSNKEKEVRADLKAQIEEAIRDTKTMEDLTSRLFTIVISALAVHPNQSTHGGH